MARGGKKRTKAAGFRECEDEPGCVICLNAPPVGEGQHHCNTCAPGAWVVCAKCEDSIRGKTCPLCRADYMREPTSGWEALPTSTTTLELDSQPTQDELKRLAVRFPSLHTLEISVDYEDEPEELDFSDGVRFPALISLTLSCIGLRSITFTEANTPMLKRLSLSNILGSVCPFHLALPQLQSFSAEHTMLGERPIDAGQFGLSLSRCPRLETVDTYNFRCLGDVNYAVAPSLRSLRLHRSECSSHLDLLYAPKLRDVSLQAAYELTGFKLRNIPTANLAMVEALLVARTQAQESAATEALAEDARWRDQSNQKALTKEARKRGWIDRSEKWRVNSEPPAGMGGSDDGDSDDMFMGGMGGEHSAYEEILGEHCESLYQKRMGPALKAAESEHISASVADDSLPRCTIDVTNMDGFQLTNLEPQVRGRCKVRGRSSEGGFGGFGGGFGMGDFGMSGGDGSGGSDDDDDDDDDNDDDDDDDDDADEDEDEDEDEESDEDGGEEDEDGEGMFGAPPEEFMRMMQMLHDRAGPTMRGRSGGAPPPR